ncbi:uncharacterized protein DEA37_0005735 [Paragonimus westermani]|uniref:G-protein coupled receptors family 1 profile domain-containing protein n=1 Tax=Paragonimus westermani TaxID=34504 RepID=A0A5J4NRS5_9TREM|nr:uncharacterized protein DEA37_0005735 [Paragonimus westermani]
METFVLTISCLCVLITVVGLLGNLLVICVLTGCSTRMVYETFCVGLAWTDLTYLSLSCPITVVQYYIRSWIFGLFWCKVFFFIVQVSKITIENNDLSGSPKLTVQSSPETF